MTPDVEIAAMSFFGLTAVVERVIPVIADPGLR
jgi:hypothetical protein